MSKENLRKGLESWIKDTRKVAPQVESWPVAGCKLRRIGVAEIRTPEPRFPVRGGEDLTELKASLQKEGQRFPVRVRQKEDHFELVTGFRRLRACRELGRDSVLAIVHEEISDEEAERLYLMENLGGGEVEALPLAKLIAERGEGALRAMMVPASLLDRHRRLAAAPAVCRALADGRLSEEQALTLAEAEAPDALLDQVVAGGLSVAEIRYLGRRRTLEGLATAGSEEGLEAWAGRVSGELGELAEQLELLLSGRERLSAAGREALFTALEQIDSASRRWRPADRAETVQAQPTVPAPPLPEAAAGAVAAGAPAAGAPAAGAPAAGAPAPDLAGLVQVKASAFETEVLAADAPVLLHLHLPGHPPSDEAEQAVRAVRLAFEGHVKLCSMNLMTAPVEDELPRMVKIGKDFLTKNLPCVLLYHRGRQVGGLNGDLDTQDLLQLLRSRI